MRRKQLRNLMETIERMIAEFADNEKKVISLTSNKKNQYLNPFFFLPRNPALFDYIQRTHLEISLYQFLHFGQWNGSPMCHFVVRESGKVNVEFSVPCLLPRFMANIASGVGLQRVDCLGCHYNCGARLLHNVHDESHMRPIVGAQRDADQFECGQL